MTWKLMIDDERDPLNVYEHIEHVRRDPVYLEPDWRVARTVEEALSMIREHGYPDLISFDHDLGKDPVTGEPLPTGMDLAKHLKESDMDNADMPGSFRFLVHSMNVDGAANIRGLLDNYLAVRTPGVRVPSPW